MMHIAELKRVSTIVVATTVIAVGGVAVCKAMAEDPPQPSRTAEQSELARPARVWGDEKAGLACSISAEKSTYGPNEPIPVRFDLKNVSDKPITVWHCGFWPNHKWIVQDAAGRDLKLTARGKLCRERYRPDTPRHKNAPFLVQPGKTDASFGPYDLRRHFEIPEAATIHVQCVYLHNADGKWIEIASNRLSLTGERPLAAENDGVRFEAIVTNRSDQLSETGKGGRTKFDLALRITNLTGRALRFGRNRTTTASLRVTSDRTYFVKANLAFHRAVPKPKLADYPLVAPGQSVSFNAYWRDSQLRLGNEDGVDGFWAFEGIERGKHELLLGYTQRGRDIEVVGDDGATVKIPQDQMWHESVQLGHGSDAGPSIKVLLPGPPPDVRCGAIVDRLWKIPNKAAGKREKIDMALRIENRTERALYFSRYDTIWLKLRSASGKTYDPTIRRLRTRQPTTADYPLVQPGDGVTFDVDAHLYWHDDELRLGGSDGFGGAWFFRDLKPGNYGLYFQFTMPKSRLDRDIEVASENGARVKIPKDQVWTGDKAAIARITLAEQTTYWSKPVDGIAVRAEPVRPTILPQAYTNEELLGFRIFAKNMTDAERILTGYPRAGTFEITDSNGDVWLPTFLPPPHPSRVPQQEVRLKPGEARTVGGIRSVSGFRSADKSDEKWYKVLPPGPCTVVINDIRIGGVSAPLDGPPVNMTVVDLKAVKGLQLSLRADRTTLVAETPVKDGAEENQPHLNTQAATLQFYFRNVGDEPIKLNALDMVASHLTLDVTGPDKDSVRRRKRLVDRDVRAPEAKDFPRLPPGRKFMSYKAPFPGAFGMFEYELLKPGEYRIRATYAAGDPGKHTHDLKAGCWEGSVVSNEVLLTVEQPSFTFSTGGRYHIEGYGEWVVTLTETGIMSVTHWVRDTQKQYGPYSLNQRELAEVNGHIQRADASGLESSTRSAVPDSVRWTLSIKEEDEATTYRIWAQDAEKKPEIRHLAAQLGTLVRTYTKQRPVGLPQAKKLP